VDDGFRVPEQELIVILSGIRSELNIARVHTFFRADFRELNFAAKELHRQKEGGLAVLVGKDFWSWLKNSPNPTQKPHSLAHVHTHTHTDSLGVWEGLVSKGACNSERGAETNTMGPYLAPNRRG
jgi:hypothetical protein